MIILYPSRESVTIFEDLPWLGFIFIFVLGLGYFFIVKPKQEEFELTRNYRKIEIARILDELAENKQLKTEYLVKAQNEPESILDPRNADIYPKHLQSAYRLWRDTPLVLDVLHDEDYSGQIISAFIPHHWHVFLFALLLLPLLFVFEHLYSRSFVLIALVSGPILLTFLRPYMPQHFWPNPIGFCMANMVLLGALAFFSEPRAWIEFRLYGWFFKSFAARIKVPAGYFFLALSLCYLGLSRLSVYSEHFVPGSLLNLVLIGLAFALLFRVVPRKDDDDLKDPDLRFNQGYARAEVYFGQNEKDLARIELRRIQNDARSEEQMQRLAELAWRNEDDELAQLIHKRWLTQVLQHRDFAKVHTVVEMLYLRGYPIRMTQLFYLCELGIQARQFASIRKFLKAVDASEEIPSSQVVPMLETVGLALLKSALSDPLYVVEVRDALLRRAPDSHALPDLQEYFEARIHQAGALKNYDDKRLIVREVVAVIKKITAKGIEIRPKDGANQTVPWTAIRALFGASVGDGMGARGTFLISYKRKLFACHFSPFDIDYVSIGLIERHFASAWSELKRHSPEGMARVELEQFEMLKDEKEYQEKMHAFAAKHQ